MMQSSAAGRSRLPLDSQWRFHLGDIVEPVPNTHLGAYMANKAGYARGGARRGFDDSDWRTVDLPHDWAIEGTRSPEEHLDQSFLARGVGWYRRHFRLDPADRGRRLAIRFDGVATFCTVYVNGHLLHRHFCGYTPFTVDITHIARFGDDINTIAVRVDATYMEGWWYEGAGIYRHTWLIKSPPVHIADDGIFVQPQRLDHRRWNTAVEVTLDNGTDVPWRGDVRLELFGPAGQRVGSAMRQAEVPSRTSAVVTHDLAITAPLLWDLDAPHLYTMVVHAGEDEERIRFGYRSIRFDAERGFFLNDRHVLLKGTCNHQDHTGVGVAVPDSLQRFRIRRLKEMGTNAYRCAHHPPAPELLDACDELGMLVMDENRNFGSDPACLEQLRAMVLRDRNHPSVILWSLCNEEAIQATPASAAIARAMSAVVRGLDPSRPITAAVSGGILNEGGIGDELDVMSINYQLDSYDAYRARRSDQPVVAGETHCAYGTRGIYETDPQRQMFACTDEAAAAWGATARRTWRHLRQRPWVAGLFLWTGFDYHGEPSPHAWPSNSSHWGLIDLCGFDKDSAWLHRAWFSDQPFVHVLPHWTWPGQEGRAMEVRIYTNCPEAELLLNGETLGRKQVDPVEMASWIVPYAPGRLMARGYREGRCLADVCMTTSGPPAGLGLEVHPTAAEDIVAADGQYVVPVTVFAIDSAGNRVPTAGDLVRFTIEGPGRIIGVGNGDPNDLSSEKATERRLFSGLAQVLVQTTVQAGPIRLRAQADGLAAAELEVQSLPVAPRPSVPPEQPRHRITTWQRSPITATRPDPNQHIAAEDMNTWQRLEVSRGADCAWPGGYAVYRAQIKIPRRMQREGGTIQLEVLGQAEVYLDEARCATGTGTLSIPLSPGPAERTLSILVHALAAPAGLAGAVELLPPGVTP